jgi:hypothetical protein
MPKTTITPTISLSGVRVKPEFMRTKNEFIKFATSISGDFIQNGRLQPLIQQLLIQKYSSVRDMLEDLFDGMTDEQIQTAINNTGWTFEIKE